MKVNIANFKGRIPRLHPRLLPENFAQVARNTRLDDGTAAPIRNTSVAATLAASAASFTKFGVTWLGWNTFVDAAPGPVAQDRLYYTGDGAPKMRVGSTVYALRLDPPAAAPTITALSAPGADPEDVVYCYTFVTGFGEESAPSPLTAPLSVTPSVTVRVNAFAAAPSGRNIVSRRIYRSQTSVSGVTDLYFVAEIPLATTSFDHDIAANPLQEVLPSADFDPPVDTLTGLISLPNGIMAAFTGKELWFSEPFFPHAWPEKYQLKTDSDIVGLAAFGSTLVVLTNASPYVVQGTHPDSMVMERVDKNMPCLSRRGIVDVGYAALFPTNEGLGMITASNSEIVTRNLFTRDQWRALSPSSFVAEQFDGRYVFTFISEGFDGFDGGTAAATSAVDGLDGGTPAPLGAGAVFYDFGSFDSAFGAQRVGVIDVSGEAPFFMTSDVDAPTAMYSDPATGKLFMLVDGTSIVEWDAEGAPMATQVWRSRLYQLPAPVSFGAIIVESDADASGENVLRARVYASGALQREITVANRVMRLPGNRLSDRWEIELESNFPITAVRMAGSMEELFQ